MMKVSIKMISNYKHESSKAGYQQMMVNRRTNKTTALIFYFSNLR